MGEPSELPTLETVSKFKQGLEQLKRAVTSTVSLIAEIAIVVYIGMTVGAYLSNKTIVSDCSTVNLAKVGDNFVNCTVVVPKKDGEQNPPR
jgi:hypothetical protein